MASHNRTPPAVLNAPKGTRIPITGHTEGYTTLPGSRTLYRTTPRRGRRVRRHRAGMALVKSR